MYSPLSSPAIGLLEQERRLAAPGHAQGGEPWALILAGGIGSRFWPLSSSRRPKQVLALVSDQPLLREAVRRLAPFIPPERVLVATSRDIVEVIAGAVPEVPPENLLVEPEPLGTAASVAWGVEVIQRRAGEGAIACLIHADLAVAFPDAFREVLRNAAAVAARQDVLVSVGIAPARPEPAFGYVLPGQPLDAAVTLAAGGACLATGFWEKPSPARAGELVGSGALWHAGVCVARCRVVRDALAVHATELHAGLGALWADDVERFATAVQSIPFERAVLERASNLAVVPGDFGWDDVGTWAALRRARELDDDGNGIVGRAHCLDASGNVVHAEASAVVLYGVDGLVVVAVEGLTFVTTSERASDLRALIDSLPEWARPAAPGS